MKTSTRQEAEEMMVTADNGPTITDRLVGWCDWLDLLGLKDWGFDVGEKAFFLVRTALRERTHYLPQSEHWGQIGFQGRFIIDNNDLPPLAIVPRPWPVGHDGVAVFL